MIGRDRGIRVGALRHRITVQTPSKTTGALTQGQRIVSWTNRLTDEPADYEYPSGGQISRGRQVEENVRAVFTVRYRSGYSTEERVVFDGQNFGIVHVKPVLGRDRFLELHCRAVES
jgi:SPP1 family predicted phage head-tail adaptor